MTLAGRYLTRPARWAGWGVVWVVALARVYTGAHLPLDVVGGVFLGWGVGSLVNLIVGSPALTKRRTRGATCLNADLVVRRRGLRQACTVTGTVCTRLLPIPWKFQDCSSGWTCPAASLARHDSTWSPGAARQR